MFKDKLVNKKLWLEFNLYGDIVQENFTDSYRNLTYKCIEAMKWISTYCNRTAYILKADDDVFVNIYAVKKYLTQIDLVERKPKRTIMCYFFRQVKVSRDKSQCFIKFL